MIEMMQWLSKGITIVIVAWVAWVVYRDWRRHRLDIDYLWLSGIAVFDAVIQWASELALWLSWVSWLFSVIAFAVSMMMQSRARKRRQTEQTMRFAELILRESQGPKEDTDDRH